MLIQLPGGTAIDARGDDVAATDNGEVRLHTPLALSRLIERWKAENNPQLAALLTSYTDEVQELENAIWDVMVGRLTDYASGVQLDALGRIVGQKRDSLGDAAYRAHIKARIRINQSFGQPRDIIAVIKLVDSSPFHLVEYPTASFAVWFDEPPATTAVGHELPSLIKQTRAAGVSGIVSFPVDRLTVRGAFFGSSYDPALNVARGFSSSYDTTVGGLFAHAART
jgi:hypothetical protein